jgi:hypothetical protein
MGTTHRRTNFLSDSLTQSCLMIIIVSASFGCGGDSTSGPPPPLDFSLSVKPAMLSITAGTVSPAMTVAVSGQNGFAETVNVLIDGLPPGAFSSPPTPLAIPPNGSQQVTLFIPPSTPAGSLSIKIDATSGMLSHSSTLSLGVTSVSNTAVLQEASGEVAANTIEIRGLSAGDFNPGYWQKNTLNWVPDVREPMFTALTASPNQNIYAPWPLEQPTGWRLFYGGWDGSDTPNDRVYSVTTSDFLTFENRMLVIDHGELQHVNNVNVHQAGDGSLHMVCTGGAYDGSNWPTYFSSPDGVLWNGSPEPYQAQLADIVNIQGYSDYLAGGFNAGNVLFRESSSWTLYFYDNYNPNGGIYRATGSSPQAVQFQGLALSTGADPNGVYKFLVDNKAWYLMGLMSNAPQLWYSLSNDGVTFGTMNNLVANLTSGDTAMDSVGFVTKGSQLLGLLYGGNTGSPDDPHADNQIFARWLQKKLVITDSTGAQYVAQGSYGPYRQWFQMPSSGTLEGTLVVYGEDGITPLGSSSVKLTAGKSYALVLQ